MAKKNTPNNQKGTTSVVTNSFIKGMNKDIAQVGGMHVMLLIIPMMVIWV